MVLYSVAAKCSCLRRQEEPKPFQTWWLWHLNLQSCALIATQRSQVKSWLGLVQLQTWTPCQRWKTLNLLLFSLLLAFLLWECKKFFLAVLFPLGDQTQALLLSSWIYDKDQLLPASVSINNQLTGAAFRPFVLSFGTSYFMNEKHSKGQTIRKLVSLFSTWWEAFIALRSGIKTYKLYTCKCCVKSCYCP